MQSLSVNIQTKVLNGLDEKVHKMTEIIIKKPSMQKVIYKLEKPSEELAFAYYILFIYSHVYSTRQRKVLNEDDGYNG
jgi:outer membrane lipoprotein-sorting protein